MRFPSRALWLGIAVGFIGAVLLMSTCVALIALAPGGGARGGQSIDHEPISLEQAYKLIDSGQVHLIAIRSEGNIDQYFLLEEVSPGYFEERDPSRRWNVDGVDVHIFTESMSTGVPVLSNDPDKVGLTSAQFEDLVARVERYNATTSSPIEVLDQRTND